MALILNQIAVPATASGSVPVAVVPPNSTVTLSVPSGGQTVYVGQASTVTTSTGFPINPGGPQVNFFLPPTSQIISLFVINSSATPTILGVGITSTA